MMVAKKNTINIKLLIIIYLRKLNKHKRCLNSFFITLQRSSSYSGLLLFKMSLLQTWYGLSDYKVEYRVNDSISFSYFCGLHINEVSPDHTVLYLVFAP